MKTKLLILFTALVFNAGTLTAAPLGTAFTYQGRLSDGANPAQGIYDLRFTIYDSASAGSAVAGPITNSPVGVSNGLFTVTLDFGGDVFNGDARWLEIAVRTNGPGAPGFATLSPRQALTAAPHATWASSAATAQSAVVADTLSGPLPSDKLTGFYTSQITFFNGTNEFYGEFYGDVYGDHFGDSFGDFYGDGYGITHLNASQLAFGTVPEARLSTNVAMLPANQMFSGSNVFTGPVIATNSANVIQGTFAGNGAGLTSLNGVALSSGTVGNAALQTNAVTADKVAAGQVVKSLNNLKDNVVLAAGENIILATNGNSLQVSASSVTTAWRLAGNPATDPSTNFLGTTDNQPLEIKVNSSRVLRLEPGGASAYIGNGVPTGAPNAIGGAKMNFVASGVVGAVVGGGGATNYSGNAYTNSVSGDFGTIGGGSGNTIQSGAMFSTIAGGGQNTIKTNAYYSFVGGGWQNTIQTYACDSFIGGGWYNTIQSATDATIAGGSGNTIQDEASSSAIGGGAGNAIKSGSWYCTIGGGAGNTIQSNATYATIPGGYLNIAGGPYSFAAGNYAQATNAGSFVWADSSTSSRFSSTTNNQFLIRASGGVGINTNNPNPSAMLTVRTDSSHYGIEATDGTHGLVLSPWAGPGTAVIGTTTSSSLDIMIGGVYGYFKIAANGNIGIGNSNPTNKLMVVNARCDGSSWINASDRRLKENFTSVDQREILSKVSHLPIAHWNYKADANSMHLGPVAQDFHAAFGLGADDTSIATVDADGVALAAIQGLNQKLTDELKQKQTEITELKQRLDRLEQQMNRNSGGGQ